MTEEVKNFIEENIDLIDNNKWEEIYQKEFPIGFTENLLKGGINPLEQGLNYIPKSFLYQSAIKEFIIPDNITSICWGAFQKCVSLTSIVIPNSVTTISSHAFCGCSNLTNIRIPDSVISIDYNAFYACTALTSIEIPDSVTSIGSQAFYGCSRLTSVTIPNSVTSMNWYVFANCISLTEIKYLGTKKEASAILTVSNKKWIYDSVIKKIICIDGVLEL